MISEKKLNDVTVRSKPPQAMSQDETAGVSVKYMDTNTIKNKLFEVMLDPREAVMATEDKMLTVHVGSKLPEAKVHLCEAEAVVVSYCC